MHTWEDPEINHIWTQNQAKQDDWPKETRKKCPIKVIPATTRGRLCHSLSPPMCLSTGTVLFFLLIKPLLASLLSVSIWKFFSTQLMGQGLATSLVARIQCSHCCWPTSVSGQELKSCFKLLSSIDILTILSLLILEYGMPFYLFDSSLISFSSL